MKKEISKEQKAHLFQTIYRNPYIKQRPHQQQCKALLNPTQEVLYGGAVGGGKSSFILMKSLQYVHVPGYASLVLRRTYPELSQSDGLIPRSHEWLSDTKAHWNGTDKIWTFPSGARLSFGHMQYENDKYNYKGGAYQNINFDEVTDFTESQYTYLFSRQRKPEEMDVPLSFCATGNPDGVGYDWVKKRFITSNHPQRPYIPAKLEDNPFLNLDSYEQSLSQLNPIVRQKLRYGDWEIMADGLLFQKEWFDYLDAVPYTVYPSKVRFWDLASTISENADYSASALVTQQGEHLYVEEVTQDRLTGLGLENRIQKKAQEDGKSVHIVLEQEGGSHSKQYLETLHRQYFQSYNFHIQRPQGSKEMRAQPFASKMERGLVHFVKGHWNERVESELLRFPNKGVHDDQVDALSGAFHFLQDYTPSGSRPQDVDFGEDTYMDW